MVYVWASTFFFPATTGATLTGIDGACSIGVRMTGTGCCSWITTTSPATPVAPFEFGGTVLGGVHSEYEELIYSAHCASSGLSGVWESLVVVHPEKITIRAPAAQSRLILVFIINNLSSMINFNVI
jgi:hypothetical protein